MQFETLIVLPRTRIEIHVRFRSSTRRCPPPGPLEPDSATLRPGGLATLDARATSHWDGAQLLAVFVAWTSAARTSRVSAELEAARSAAQRTELELRQEVAQLRERLARVRWLLRGVATHFSGGDSALSRPQWSIH